MDYRKEYNMKELEISLWRHWDEIGYVNQYQPKMGGWMDSFIHDNPNFPPGQLVPRIHGWD